MRKLLRHLPEPLLDLLRGSRKRYRSARYRTRERLRPVDIDRAQVAAAFRAAGLKEGDAAFLQAKMSAFGTIEGGPATVIGALEDVLGPEGLIAMPAFPLDRPALDYLREGHVFDLLETPSKMGAISERFRTTPGSERSLHPTHSVSARGPGAAQLVAGHAEAETPFGGGTPFAALIERGAHQVWFGSGAAAFTMYHAFECLREPPYPIAVFMPQRLPARCIDAERREIVVQTLVHDPHVAARRIDSNPAIEAQVRARLIEGGMRSVPLGRGEVLAQPLPRMLEELERMLGEGMTIYPPDVLEEALAA
jgi:aminoglycoside 3-N-acetyltransferase